MALLKETKQTKGDLFRPWDAASEAASQQCKTSDKKTFLLDSRRSEKKSYLKTSDPLDKQEEDTTSDSRSQPLTTDSSSGLLATQASFQTQFLPYLPHGHPMSDAIRSFPFDQQQLSSMNPSMAFNLFSSHETNMLNTFFPGNSHHFLDTQTANSRLLKPSQKKQRPKRFQCPHCQVSFSNNGQLRGHVRIHTGMSIELFLT